jgi:hypothetical protein
MRYSDLWHMNAADWHHVPGSDNTTFTPCDVDAALTISAAYKTRAPISEEENAEMAQRGAPTHIERSQITCGEFTGLTAEYEDHSDDGSFFVRVWWLYSDHVHIYATYNCSLEYAQLHRDIVDGMMSTLRKQASTDLISE